VYHVIDGALTHTANLCAQYQVEMGGETRRSILRALAGAAVLTTGVEKASAIQTYTTPRPFVADYDKYKVRCAWRWMASFAF